MRRRPGLAILSRSEVVSKDTGNNNKPYTAIAVSVYAIPVLWDGRRRRRSCVRAMRSIEFGRPGVVSQSPAVSWSDDGAWLRRAVV